MNGPGYLDGRMAWLSNGRGRYQEALAAAEQGRQYPDDLGLGTWSVVEFIEAAVRSSQMEEAKMALHQLLEVTLACESDWAVGITARCRALVSEGDDAEALYQEAVERLARTDIDLELARAHLLYGEWLRRTGRRVDARRVLRLAHDIFAEMGVDGFAERARRELVATGETARRRSVETLSELTPQESEICRLAGEGYTNAEIAEILFINRRTVEWHLRKVFVKLGIRSRRQLRHALPGIERVLSPA
jgi:DNA-binding CsgD family transcriptional regulator